MNRIVALLWAGATLAIGAMAFSIALGPKGDASGWVMAAIFAGVTAFAGWQAWKEWNAAEPLAARPAPMPQRKPEPATDAPDAPGAWRGPPVKLETQIGELAKAGLVMAPGRTIAELLHSFPREDFESDPYNLILFMYGVEVEAEPWGRAFCERGWNFDTECLVQTGDYVSAFENILRITGQPQLVTGLSDDFDMHAETCEIRYTLNGRQKVLRARVESDWADPEAVAAFVRDIEAAIADGRHFWAADNGQASVLFFVTDAEAAKVNALREDILVRYADA
jgi:hypothetical protein